MLLSRPSCALTCLPRSCSLRTSSASAGSLIEARAPDAVSACWTERPRIESARLNVSAAMSPLADCVFANSLI